MATQQSHIEVQSNEQTCDNISVEPNNDIKRSDRLIIVKNASLVCHTLIIIGALIAIIIGVLILNEAIHFASISRDKNIEIGLYT